jgi:hypothetical protein
MTKKYRQFLGNRPGTIVEVVDDSKSPHRVRTDSGFEFMINSEDFSSFFKESEASTPDRWQHLVTERESGFVESRIMSEVMSVIGVFESLCQDYNKARNFAREAAKIVLASSGDSYSDLVRWVCDSGLDEQVINEKELKRVCTAGPKVLGLLADEICATTQWTTHVEEKYRQEREEPLTAESALKRSGIAGSKKPSKAGKSMGMKNVGISLDGDIMTITVDLSQDFGPSKSGKTTIVASTEGNKTIPGREEKIGLNIYRQESDSSKTGKKSSFKNVEMNSRENTLDLRIDLSKEFGPSKSGKTIIIASTEGNQLVPERQERVGLNIYRKIE